MKKLLIIIFIVISLIAATGLGVLFFLTTVPWVNLTRLEQYDNGIPSIVLDSQGNEWARFAIDRRLPISLTQIPSHVINAFLAAEDHTFFNHSGLSFRGIARSCLVNILKGGKIQGASTITQQLVRLIYFGHKKTFQRKIKEQILALAIERQFTKEIILEAYLNNLYFGCGIYGVQAACQRFWDKPITDISIGQAAALAATIASPEHYCPLENSKKADTRRLYILQRMLSLGFISPQEYDCACKENNKTKEHDTCVLAPHSREYIRTFLENLVGRQELYTQGYIIHTTLDSVLQKKAQKAFGNHIDHLHNQVSPHIDGALLTMDADTGALKAVIGGYDFVKSYYNRAFDAYRQMGSIFKTIIYSTALERGFDLDMIEVDEPIIIDDNKKSWTPHNYNNQFDGPMTLAHALATSKNTISIKLLQKVGIENVINVARSFDLSTHLEPYPSLALGCVDASPLEVAGMFNIFANRGIYVKPYLISCIKDRWGKKIYRHKAVSKNVLSWSTSSKIAQNLIGAFDALKSHTRYKDNPLKAFGKSGTTNQWRTCWYAGSTPQTTTIVYIGKDDNQSLGKNAYPVITTFPLWMEVQQYIKHDSTQSNDFLFDPSLEPVCIDPLSGKPVNDTQSNHAITILKQKK